MQKKKGISLIVLVITIIVMIILAVAVVITLNNTGIINKANQAVDLTNEKQVQDLAAVIWTEAHMDNLRGEALVTEVTTKLSEQGITADKWNITVTDTGINVSSKNNGNVTSTLGSLITAENYGDTVNYEANGVTNWKVFYETENYVYLIASEKLAYDKVPTILKETVANGGAGATIGSATVALGENDTRTVGQVYWASSSVPTSAATIQNPTMWMAEWSNYSTNENGRCVSYFLNEDLWTSFKNTTKYKDANGNSYVKGAIGTPTAEMFVASWNAKREAKNDTTIYNKKLSLVANGTTGYYVNDITTSDPASSNTYKQTITTIDNLYVWSTASNSSTWLASPPGNYASNLLNVSYGGYVSNNRYSSTSYGVRPVVCLSSSIPAVAGSTTDFEI